MLLPSAAAFHCLCCCLQEDDDIASLASEDSEPSEAESAELWGRHLPSPFEDPTAVQARPKQPSPEKRRREVGSLGQLLGAAVGAATCTALSCSVMWAASAYWATAASSRGPCCTVQCCWAHMGVLRVCAVEKGAEVGDLNAQLCRSPPTQVQGVWEPNPAAAHAVLILRRAMRGQCSQVPSA